MLMHRYQQAVDELLAKVRETQTENVGDVVDLFLEGKVELMDPSFACRH